MANSNRALDNLLLASNACANVALENNLTMEYTLLARSINMLLRASKPDHSDVESVVKYAAYFGEQGMHVINYADAYQYELDRQLQGR